MPQLHRTSFPPPLGRSVRVVAGASLALLTACSKQVPASAQSSAGVPAASATSTLVPPPGASPTGSLTAAAAAASPSAAHAESGIAWRAATNDADIDAAFAAARAADKPVFVYWGAKWCPPCNQVKATLFNRQDFHRAVARLCAGVYRRRQPGGAEARRALSCQRLPDDGAFQPAGQRADAPARRSRARALHPGADTRHERRATGARGAAQALGTNQGEAGGVRTREVAGDRSREVAGDRSRDTPSARARPSRAPAPLTPNDWRLLAFYAWDTDE